MDGMDIEIPDAEDASCDMDQLSSYFGRRGQYEEAAMVDGAARRMRADADEIARLTRERDEAVRVVSFSFGKVCEWHDLIESEQDFEDDAADGVTVRMVVLKEMDGLIESYRALRVAMGASEGSDER